MLRGIAASSGVAIARVYKLEQPTVEIVKKMLIRLLRLRNSMRHWKKQKTILSESKRLLPSV